MHRKDVCYGSCEGCHAPRACCNSFCTLFRTPAVLLMHAQFFLHSNACLLEAYQFWSIFLLFPCTQAFGTLGSVVRVVRTLCTKFLQDHTQAV